MKKTGPEGPPNRDFQSTCVQKGNKTRRAPHKQGRHIPKLGIPNPRTLPTRTSPPTGPGTHGGGPAAGSAQRGEGGRERGPQKGGAALFEFFFEPGPPFPSSMAERRQPMQRGLQPSRRRKKPEKRVTVKDIILELLRAGIIASEDLGCPEGPGDPACGGPDAPRPRA